MPSLDEFLGQKLIKQVQQNLLRTPTESTRNDGIYIRRNGRTYTSFCCNDYLGLSSHPTVKSAATEAIHAYGTGSGASRLVTGNHPLYTELESRLATHKGTEDAVVFGSGYLTNMGTLQALAGKDDLILADKLSHACLLDGARLSGAKLLRFNNNDVAQCRKLLEKHRNDYRHCFIITDAVFSMDGHLAPVNDLYALAESFDSWLLTDNAHGLGVLPDREKSPAHIQTGTLSKAIGGYGGYVCGSKTLCQFLRSNARTLVYSTALPPAIIAAAIASLDVIESEPELTRTPLNHARLFTSLLSLDDAQSPIVPLIIGDEETALSAAKTLENHGFLVTAIRPPTVPPGTARLRFTFSVLHNRKEIVKLADIVRQQGWIGT